MPNLPKPPKLYYYIAGLTVFILALGSVGFYFYQKENSLTSNKEQSKTLEGSNNQPKEENLTSGTKKEIQLPDTSFENDPNTDVIVFEECNIVLKIKKSLKNSRINAYSKSNTGVGRLTSVSRILGFTNNNILISETDDIITHNQTISCSKVTDSDIAPQENQSNQEYSSTLISSLKKDYKDLIVNEFTMKFSYKNYNYYIDESLISTPLINSAKFDFENLDKYNQIKVVNLDLIPDSIAAQSNTQNISSLNLLGCRNTWWVSDINFDRCILSDQDFSPILDLNTLLPSKNSPTDSITAWLGKKTPSGQYIILAKNIAINDINYVYELNFNTKEINNIKSSIKYEELGDYQI